VKRRVAEAGESVRATTREAFPYEAKRDADVVARPDLSTCAPFSLPQARVRV
jgi:hypothetical protein